MVLLLCLLPLHTWGVSLLPLRSRGLSRECVQIQTIEHEASLVATPSPIQGRDRSCIGNPRLGAHHFPALFPLVRMSKAASEQPLAASKGDEGENSTKAVNVIIKGRVQGVYYRNWTVDSAQQLGVNGWVRNLKDGSVEAVFSGKSSAVNSLIDKCHTGPSAAQVSSVEVSVWKDDVPQGFERKATGG